MSTSTAPTRKQPSHAAPAVASRDWEDPRFWALVLAVLLVAANAVFRWNLGTTETLLVSTLLAYSVGKSVVTAAQAHAQMSANTVASALSTVEGVLQDLGALASDAPARGTGTPAADPAPATAETTTGGA